jgi:hypothetical protein
VTYSEGECAGAIQKSSATTTRAALSAVPTASDTAGATTIYRCTGYTGVVFWSSAHCNQKKALIDRVVSVPRGLSFQQQTVVAERSLPRAQPVVARPVQSASPAVAQRQQECKGLDETVRSLDARARQAISATEQDRLRERRQRARDRQFALHC